MSDEPEINWPLLWNLTEKPHPLLNVASRPHEVPEAWLGEVMQETRTAHHLLDMISVPAPPGDASHIDARTYLAIRRVIDADERLARIATWHSRETGPGGMIGDFCVTCESRWPCDTRRMAEGTYTDEDQP